MFTSHAYIFTCLHISGGTLDFFKYLRLSWKLSNRLWDYEEAGERVLKEKPPFAPDRPWTSMKTYCFDELRSCAGWKGGFSETLRNYGAKRIFNFYFGFNVIFRILSLSYCKNLKNLLKKRWWSPRRGCSQRWNNYRQHTLREMLRF